MVSPTNFAVLGVSLTEVNPGLTFWTIVTFLVLFFIMRRKAWGPILNMVQEREKTIQVAIDAAKQERQEAERLLAEQKKALADTRAEAAQLQQRNKADAEKVREELMAKSRKEAEEVIASARQMIEDEKAKALAEVRGYAVDLALQAAQKLVEVSLDETRQRQLVADFIERVDQERPAA